MVPARTWRLPTHQFIWVITSHGRIDMIWYRMIILSTKGVLIYPIVLINPQPHQSIPCLLPLSPSPTCYGVLPRHIGIVAAGCSAHEPMHLVSSESKGFSASCGSISKVDQLHMHRRAETIYKRILTAFFSSVGLFHHSETTTQLLT